MSLGSDQETLEGPQEGSDVELKDQDPDPPGARSPPMTRGWNGRQRDSHEPGEGEGAKPGSHDEEEGEQPMECQPAAVPEERMDRNEGQDRARPNTRSQTQARQKKVTFMQATTNSLCSTLVTKAPRRIFRRDEAPTTGNHIKTS